MEMFPIVMLAKFIGSTVPLPLISFIVSIAVSIIRLRGAGTNGGMLSTFTNTIRAYLNKPEVVQARNTLVSKGFSAAQSNLERRGWLVKP